MASLLQRYKVIQIIIVRSKDGLPVMTSLDYMMRAVGDNNA